MVFAMRSLACPSPYGLCARAMVSYASGSSRSRLHSATLLSRLGPTNRAVPARTASGRSVLSRITSTGFPSDGASSWIPPELTKDQQRQILNRHDHSNTEIRQTW